jgi:tyrosyl-tRNA synthetase
MQIETNYKKIDEVLTRGVEKIIDLNHLKKRLLSGHILRIKHGIDPTGPKIHIGRAAQLWKLKDFQELGHKIILIIGDFTAQIGDASDKQAMRRPLTQKEVKENMRDYVNQIAKILDIKKIELYYNSEWLNKLTVKELLNLAMNFTAQQTIQRRNFKERWEEGKPIGLHELVYPLLQGYDSVAVKADVELGGFDQLFNLKIGREIQKIFGQKPQDIITLKMVSGLDGHKMSTSQGNVINITDKPEEQFGKIMSMKDELILNYFELCTRTPLEEIRKMRRGLEKNQINPRDLKINLAKEIVKMYHGEEAALRAKREFEMIFKEKKLPLKIPEIRIKEKKLNILEFLVKVKLVPSKSEAKRLILQKGVKIDGEIQENWRKIVEPKKGMIIQVGKRRFKKLI